MAKLPRIAGPRLVRALERAGWFRHRQKGSHLVMKHPGKPKARVVVPMHSGEELLPKTLASILDQAEMSADELRELL